MKAHYKANLSFNLHALLEQLNEDNDLNLQTSDVRHCQINNESLYINTKQGSIHTIDISHDIQFIEIDTSTAVIEFEDGDLK